MLSCASWLSRRGLLVVMTGHLVGGAALASTQEVQFADRGPAFLVLPSPNAPAGTPAVDGRNAAPFRRRVTLTLISVPVPDALTAITRQTGLRFLYQPALISAGARVSVATDNMTVAAVLTEILLDTGLDVALTGANQAALIPHGHVARAMTRSAQAGGRVEGRVTDANSGQPLPNATVTIVATNFRATTKDDGQYVIAGIPPGTYSVDARVLGHAPLSKQVDVHADAVAHLDFALVQAATSLEQVVTTAVGDQRRVELGNSIATINTDSITKTAPITSLTDVLSGRAPGVEVLESSGVIGSPVRIRIRGLSSLQLSNNPIVYVDGVRINSDPGYNNPVVYTYNYGSYLTGSRLNDLNPDEIQSIDVLKGPSAATEYGTDAANGVIVIKTKQGQAGAPRWDLNTEQGLSTVPVHFPAPWHAWGHTTDASHAPVQCPLTNGYGAPSVGTHSCAIDSVTTYQPFDHAATSALTSGHSQQYNLQVSGGAQQLKYFVAGALASQTGVLRLDPADAKAMADSGTSIPSYARTPNVANNTTLRGRFTIPLGSAADLAASTAYISNYNRGAPAGDVVVGAEAGLGYRDPVYNGWAPFPFLAARNAFLNTASQAVSRFTGGLSTTWRPALWLATHATVGADAGTENDLALRATPPVNNVSEFTYYNGTFEPTYRGQERQTRDLYTVDVGATATVPLTGAITSKTSAGVQYNDSRQSGTTLLAYGISQNGSFNGAAISIPGQVGDYVKTFGSYVEEMVGVNERLFMTGALRVDAGSGFGTDVHSAVYPKASVSWLMWDTPRQSIRLRAAYGTSGVQPKAGSTLTLFSPAAALVGGVRALTDTLTAIGNARLKPEHQSEFEGGIDASLLNRRANIELTYYTKLSHDALVSVVLPGSIGGVAEEENVGSVRNYGVEGSVTTHLLDLRRLQWDVTVGGSVNTNRLASLAPHVPPVEGLAMAFLAQYRDVPGYAVNGLWAPLLHYQDLNHDGIIEPNEVSVDTTMRYMGPGLPTQELTFSTSVGLWGGRLRVGTQFDHRGGFTIENVNYENTVDGFLTTRALVDPRVPRRQQARAVAAQLIFSPLNSGYMENGTFTRWREVSLRYLMPDPLAHALRARSMSITLSGRNLLLWTRYTGPDPEATTIGVSGSLPLDASLDYNSFPLVRTWAMRVDVAL